ncbi:hypothetical protein L209DRAFT_392554 [Thermothelomyces heterothallicus CBS 203.75]
MLRLPISLISHHAVYTRVAVSTRIPFFFGASKWLFSPAGHCNGPSRPQRGPASCCKFGYDQGIMSGLLTGKAFTAQFPEIDTTEGGAGGSASLQGTVVAIYEIGCFLGAIIALLIGEKIGRRKTIMLGCLVLCIGGAFQACTYGIPHIITKVKYREDMHLDTAGTTEPMPHL